MGKTTLVTFLGKGRDDPGKGYRTATYRFRQSVMSLG